MAEHTRQPRERLTVRRVYEPDAARCVALAMFLLRRKPSAEAATASEAEADISAAESPRAHRVPARRR